MKVNEENLKKKLPQLKLNPTAKERIHTALLNHQPLSHSSKSFGKGGKWRSLVATVLGIFIFSLLTVYIISETEREREHEQYLQAKEEIQAIYSEMEGNLKETAEGERLKPLEESRLKSAQSSLSAVENTSESEKEKKKLVSMMKDIEMYNQISPYANDLQTKIDHLNTTLSQNVFDKDLEKEIDLLKNDLSKKIEGLDRGENLLLKKFINNQYSPQVNTLEDEFKKYKVVQEAIHRLDKISEDPSVGAEEFHMEVEDLLRLINQLANKPMASKLEEEVDMAKNRFKQNSVKREEKNQLAANVSSKEEIATPKEEDVNGSVSKEKGQGKPTESNTEEELYPMEFTMTDSEGHTFKMSRDFDKYRIGKGYDDIARKYGARYYYTPNSDVSHVIIGRDIIATVSLVSGADVKYKDLFIDLMTYESNIYTREEFAVIVEKVIQSGEPYLVEEGNAGELLKIENGRFFYHSW